MRDLSIVLWRNKILRKALLRCLSNLCYSNFMGKRKSTKENLIPFEKSKRVILLDRRGPEGKGRIIGAFVLAGLAVLCALYFLAIFLFMGYGSKFFLIWAVMAAGFGAWSFVLFCPLLLQKLPRWFKRTFMICVIVGLVLFAFVEGLVFSQVNAKAENGADYVIVLGAQWKSSGPSYMLQKRLDKAVEYLNANPDTIVIVSGGQGANEPISEAEGMAGYLEDAGIAPERIIQEAASTSTDENLEFSSAFLDKENATVVLVTNNYHVFRAKKLAEKQGYTHVEGLAADSHLGMLPNNVLREFLAVIKDFLAGNI